MSNNPTQHTAWKNLKKHAANIQKIPVNTLFQENPDRFEQFSTKHDNVFFDYSKQHINQDILNDLIALAQSCNLETRRSDLFSGKKINKTENRSVLHTALRQPKNKNLTVDDQDISDDVQNTLNRMKELSESVRAEKYLGATGKAIKKIISIGIGGSDFGPRLVCNALKSKNGNIKLDFVSNIDASDISYALNKSDPETTLFIVISKSFTTNDTLINANTAKQWLQNNLPNNTDVAQQFIAVTANTGAAQAFGIQKDNILPIWEWVNGRFSLWSAVGLPICFKFGFDVFRDLLDGAYNIDKHFQEAPLDKNIPVLMALIGIWNRNFLKSQTLAILPYSQRLFYLPAYLRQLDMESNGKTINLDGEQITDYQTGPVIFGEAGTNGQHSFYQHLHQGSDLMASDFIGILDPEHDLKEHQSCLMNNMLAQSQALMQGRQKPNSPHRYFSGNKPNSTILLEKLDAKHLGMLLALYEHKTFVQGVIWHVNSFDQYGVELGKELSKKLVENDLSEADSSTKGLLSLIHKAQK